MPISIAQIITVAAPAALIAVGKPYKLSEIAELPAIVGYYTTLRDPYTLAAVSIAWTQAQELALHTERDKINFVKQLLENAIHSLDDYILSQGHDVPFQPRFRYEAEFVPDRAGPNVYNPLSEMQTVDFGE